MEIKLKLTQPQSWIKILYQSVQIASGTCGRARCQTTHTHQHKLLAIGTRWSPNLVHYVKKDPRAKTVKVKHSDGKKTFKWHLSFGDICQSPSRWKIGKHVKHGQVMYVPRVWGKTKPRTGQPMADLKHWVRLQMLSNQRNSPQTFPIHMYPTDHFGAQFVNSSQQKEQNSNIPVQQKHAHGQFRVTK